MNKPANASLVKSAAQQVETKTKYTLEDYIFSKKTEIMQALPKMVSVERFTRVAITAIKTNKALRECDINSFLASIITAAQLGLEVNTPLGEAWVIPYSGKAQFQIGYKGMLALAYRSGMFRRIDTREVYKEDLFEYNLGIPAQLHHIPSDSNSGSIVKYYALYELTNGGYNFVVDSQSNLMKFASLHSQAYKAGKKDSPWFTTPAEMCKKTLLKRLLKLAPMSVEYRLMLESDESIKTQFSPVMTEIPNEFAIDFETGELTDKTEESIAPDTTQLVTTSQTSEIKDKLI